MEKRKRNIFLEILSNKKDLNQHQVKKTDLCNGEVICNRCNGAGTQIEKKMPYLTHPCEKCLGKGKLDWIENVVGKSRYFWSPPYLSVSSYLDLPMTLIKSFRFGKNI